MREAATFLLLLLLVPNGGRGSCEDEFDRTQATPERRPAAVDSIRERLDAYVGVASRHRLTGLASYYSTSLDGRPTASGEIFRNGEFTAAHLSLPLGSWVEITSRATGRSVRCRVNDRGPFAKKFAIDLSQAAARAIGVDRHPDRYVSIRLIALPGDEPLPDEYPGTLHAACDPEERE